MQHICRDDGSLAVSGEGIFTEMKKRYGKESLEVNWYNSIEEEMNSQCLREKREHC